MLLLRICISRVASLHVPDFNCYFDRCFSESPLELFPPMVCSWMRPSTKPRWKPPCVATPDKFPSFLWEGPERPDGGALSNHLPGETGRLCSPPGRPPGTRTPLSLGAVHTCGTSARVARIHPLRRVQFLEKVQTLLGAEMGGTSLAAGGQGEWVAVKCDRFSRAALKSIPQTVSPRV